MGKLGIDRQELVLAELPKPEETMPDLKTKYLELSHTFANALVRLQAAAEAHEIQFMGNYDPDEVPEDHDEHAEKHIADLECALNLVEGAQIHLQTDD